MTSHGTRIVKAFAGLALLVSGVRGYGQSTKTQHESAAQPATVIATSTARPANMPATIRYSDGILEVTAVNASLNQILRDVAARTGMKLTGLVRDERVYGNYGPQPAAVVLATLLEGTGCNMLLVEGAAASAPKELILTPRTGGSTPPSPAAAPVSAVQTEISRGDGVAAPTSVIDKAGKTATQGNEPESNAAAPPAMPPVLTPQQLYDRSIQLQSQQRQAAKH